LEFTHSKWHYFIVNTNLDEYFISMEHWRRYFQRAKENLSRHDPGTALKNLQMAIEECPASDSKNLSKVLFYTGITLKKLGVPNGALKSWVLSQKLIKSGYCSKMIKRFINDYGMSKQETESLDDWKAFHAIQLAKYLGTKENGKLHNTAEQDAIGEIIYEYWKYLCKTISFEEKNLDEKVRIFNQVNLFSNGPQTGRSGAAVCIPINFKEKRKYFPQDRCGCGSGLPFCMCCGRTPGADELISGSK
jgi:hypothetical protein